MSKENLCSSLRKASAKHSVNFMSMQRLCKNLEQGNIDDIFVEFYSNLAEVYDKHVLQFQDIYNVE